MTEQDHFQRYLAQARHLSRAKQYDRAVQRYQAALALQPDHAPAHSGMAWAFYFLEKFAEADYEADRALQQEPDNCYFLYLKGCARLALGHFPEAERYFVAAIAGEPNEPEFRTMLGNVYLVTKRYWLAEESGRAALALAPASVRACLLIGKALEANNKPEEARFYFGEAQRLNPESSEAHHRMALHNFHHADAEASIGQMREALRLDPTNKTLHYNFDIVKFYNHPLFRPLRRFNKLDNRTQIIARFIVFFILLRLADKAHEAAAADPSWQVVSIGLYVLAYGLFIYVVGSRIALQTHAKYTARKHGRTQPSRGGWLLRTAIVIAIVLGLIWLLGCMADLLAGHA